MFEAILKFFKRLGKKEQEEASSKDTAKERLHLVLMQDRANMSADFLDMMKQEIIEVIKKYIDVDEKEIDVKLTNKTNEDGTVGAPALYANIPIMKIKQDVVVNNTNNEEKATKVEVADNNIETAKAEPIIEVAEKIEEEQKEEVVVQDEEPKVEEVPEDNKLEINDTLEAEGEEKTEAESQN